MSRNQRFSLLGLAVIVLVVAFVLARSGGDDDNESAGTSTTTSDTSQTTTTSTETGGATPKPKAPTVPTVVVRDAKPVGGVKRISFKHNDRVVFVVKSDTADEVHFHGYDVAKEVEAGGTVRFNVKGTIEGRFEVELEDHKEQIAEVEVTP